jgi:outer membrane protein OmpA-like peptidoglycan-associated protein
MTKVLKTLLMSCALLVCYTSHAQTQRDSNNAEIKKQALEMRERVNKYMADKLMEQPATPSVLGTLNAATQSMIDSIANLIALQQAQINQLSTNFKELKQAVETVAKKQVNAEVKDVLEAGFRLVGPDQLIVYFPFDGYQLNAAQIKVLGKFMGNKRIKSITLKGYTDWVGTERHNSSLAKFRCSNVALNIGKRCTNIRQEVFINCSLEDRNVKTQLCRKVEIYLNR